MSAMPEAAQAICPALLISAPASGQGKTTVTAALARAHRNAGRRVRVFKCGPDFLDPMILEQASGAAVQPLDLFMVGEDACRRLLHEAARVADVILIEGAMGLFDGDPSAADLAALFSLPILAVIDGSGMAQTFGAVALGLATYRDDVNVAAVLANRVGSDRHAQLLAQSVPPSVRWLGAMARDADAAIPARHLGLVQAVEIDDLERRIECAASALPREAVWLPDPVRFDPPSRDLLVPRPLDEKRIAVARDPAFSFIYQANIACLEAMGARLAFFSPLEDGGLPDCDALWLPGGYPELHGRALAANATMIAAIRRHHAAGKPILAECGGMLYCLDEIVDKAGTTMPMAGLMPGRAVLQPRLAGLGMQTVELSGGTLRGHTFHYSRLSTPLAPIARARRPDGADGEAVFRIGSLTATYMHGYFPSSPEAIADIMG